mgnify:CR=1 FL=1
MKMNKSMLVILSCFIIFSTAQDAEAFLISDLVDVTINCISRTTYIVTKYSLKTSVFIIKKTAKGTKSVSKSIYTASKDAFKTPAKPESPEIQPVRNFTPVNNNILPPVPQTTISPSSKSKIPPGAVYTLPVISY